MQGTGSGCPVLRFSHNLYRCYSAIAFPKKWDKEGKLVRRYVPELKSSDVKYIYEPWKTPIADQKKAGVKIQGDGKEEEEGVYPKPMFDFNERRSICLDGMEKAYQVGFYGDDEKVIDGTWRKLFDDAAERPTAEESFEDAIGIRAGIDEKVQDGQRNKSDDAVEEDESGGKEEGGENRGGDKSRKGGQRKRGQGTLDGHAKRSKQQP
jgi:cryptochrome